MIRALGVIIAVAAGYYGLTALLVLIGSAIFLRPQIRFVAHSLGASPIITLLLGSALWPWLARSLLSGRR